MRVYGSSPLYNYVELIFRSKRLFIVSVVLATVVTVTVAARRAGTYEAEALIYLTGANNPDQNVSQAQRGSIQYKLNLLSVMTKDPKFMKDALRDHGLDKDKVTGRQMTEEEFDEFSKKARAALRFASGNNVMEISCRWKDARCEDIINAFYSAYSRRVLDEETLSSHIAAKTLRSRLQEYTNKQRALEQKIIDFKQQNVEQPVTDYGASLGAYNRSKDAVDQYQAQLNTLHMMHAEVQRQLDNTPQTVVDAQIKGSRDPYMDKLLEAKAFRENELADMRQKYTDDNPIIRKQLGIIEQVDKMISARQKVTGSKNNSLPGETREVINPQFVGLEQKKSELELQIQQYEGQLADARKMVGVMRRKTLEAPQKIKEFEWQIADLRLYAGIRANLRAKLEQAEMEERQERDMHLAEMKMIVEPEAELEVVGAKSVMFYAAGPILGLIIAFAFSLLAESLDHSLRTPIEVEKYLGKPVLAVLPRIDTPKESHRRLGGGGDAARPSLPS